VGSSPAKSQDLWLRLRNVVVANLQSYEGDGGLRAGVSTYIMGGKGNRIVTQPKPFLRRSREVATVGQQRKSIDSLFGADKHEDERLRSRTWALP
jgi:hypothetical protein